MKSNSISLNKSRSNMSATPIDFSDKSRRSVIFPLRSKESIFKALYEHGKLNRDAPPLRVCDVEDIAKRAGFHSFKVYSPEEYNSKAEKMNEPKEAVLFIIKKNANVGHFVGVFTDDQNRIHYGDSFGSINEVAINPSNRKLIVAHNAIESVSTTNNIQRSYQKTSFSLKVNTILFINDFVGSIENHIIALSLTTSEHHCLGNCR